jgi:hypothetical protein
MAKDMLNSKGAQRFSENHESERLGRLTKEYAASPYLRAPTILRFRPNPCNLRVMPRAEGTGLAETIREMQIDKLKAISLP